MIKNIIYDLGNVIINFNQEKIINHFTRKDNEIKYIYDEIFKAPEWGMMDLGKISNEVAAQNINERNNYIYKDLTDNFFKEWFKIQTINRDIVENAKELKKKGYNLYVISNMAKPTYEYFKDDEFFSLCSGIIISANEHIKKPDEKIYKILLDRYNLNAEECIFIDDDDSGKNYVGANNVGIKGKRVKANDLQDIIKMLNEYGVTNN